MLRAPQRKMGKVQVSFRQNHTVRPVRSALAGKLFSNETARLFVWWYPLPRLCVKEGASEPQRREARHSFCEKGYVRDGGT